LTSFYADYPVVGEWIQAVEFSKWRTDRVNEAILKEGLFEENAKTNDVCRKFFNTDTYLAAPTMTYGGNEEIVLKGAKEQKHLRQVKMVLFREPECICKRSSGILCRNTDSYRRLNGNMLLLLMLVKENIIFTRSKEISLVRKLYAFWQRQSQEINLQTLNKVMVIMVV
jgi:hypothetical protein